MRATKQTVRRKLETILKSEGDMGVLELADLLDAPVLQRLMDDLYPITCIPMAIIDVKGRVLVRVGWQDVCTRFHRTNPESCRNCIESDTVLTKGVLEGDSRLYKCKNNLWDMATPIFVAGRHLGNVFTGQFLLDDEVVDWEGFRTQARQYGFDETEYLAALDRVPRLDRAKADRVMSFLVKLAHSFSQLSYSNARLARLLAERMTDSLRRSESRYRRLLQGIPVPLRVVSQTGGTVYFNDRFIQLFGYTAADIPTLEVWWQQAYPDPAYRRRVIEKWHEMIQRPVQTRTEPEEFKVTCKDGSLRVVVVSDLRIGDDILACFTDITERQRAEDNLETALRFQQQILDSIPIPVFYKNEKSVYLGCNKSYEQFMGLERNGIVGKTVYDLAPPDLARIYHDQDAYLFAHPGVQVYECEVESKALQANRHVVFHKATFEDPRSRTGGIIGGIIDITERKRAEEALRQSEGKLRGVLDNAADAVFLASPQSRFVYANRAASALLGYTREELLSMGIPDITPAEEISLVQGLLQRVQTEKQVRVELRLKRKDGALVPVELNGTLLPDGNVYVSCRDATERKRLEGRLRQAEKMEGIGHLAGGMAHEFNNILAGMVINLSLARMSGGIAADSDMLQDLEVSCQRAAGLIRQLLAFSRQSIMERRSLDVAATVSDQLRRLQEFLGGRIQVEFDGPPAPAWVKADRALLEQAILNLCLNARDAMKNGGRLHLRVHKELVGEERSETVLDARPGHYVCISVSDTGCGIDERGLARLFEPFFTTKDVGRGTGLGLATVRGIVQQHQGWIEVESRVGEGTAFSIYLPVDEEAGAAARVAPSGGGQHWPDPPRSISRTGS